MSLANITSKATSASSLVKGTPTNQRLPAPIPTQLRTAVNIIAGPKCGYSSPVSCRCSPRCTYWSPLSARVASVSGIALLQAANLPCRFAVYMAYKIVAALNVPVIRRQSETKEGCAAAVVLACTHDAENIRSQALAP